MGVKITGLAKLKGYCKQSKKKLHEGCKEGGEGGAMKLRDFARFYIYANAGIYEEHSKEWEEEKGFQWPLVWYFYLYRALSYNVLRWDQAEMGIPFGAKHGKTGDDLVVVGWALHEGRSGSTAKGKTWRMPARPFIDYPTNSGEAGAKILDQYFKSIIRAFGIV